MYKLSRYFILSISSCIFYASVFAQSSKALPAEYSFKLGITYELTGGKAGETPRTTTTTFWFSEKDYAGFDLPKQQGMLIVYDLPNKQMLTFMTDKKMVMVMDMGKMEQKIDSIKKQPSGQSKKEAGGKLIKTGKTEMILGYSCDQYQMTSSNSTALIWVTKELGAGFGNFAQGFSQLMKSNPSGTQMPDMKAMGNGMMLKMESKSTESGSISRLEAKSIHKEGKKISTAGYKIMAIPGN